MFYWIDLLVLDRSSVSRVVLINFDHLGPSGLPSVQFDLLLDRSSMNGLIGKACLWFNRDVWPIETYLKISDIGQIYFSYFISKRLPSVGPDLLLKSAKRDNLINKGSWTVLSESVADRLWHLIHAYTCFSILDWTYLLVYSRIGSIPASLALFFRIRA